MKRQIFLSWGPTDPATCPRCRQTLRSATGLSPTRRMQPSNGALTICDQCFTWLVFVAYVFPQPHLALRLATAAEIATLDPEMRALAEDSVRGLATMEPTQ